jgi:hypothetical protein
MYRSSRPARRRALEWLGICAAMLILGWPAGSAPRTAAAPMSLAAADRPGAVGPQTLAVYPASVTASDPMTTLAFTYTANLVQDGTLTITVPPGWTPPSQAPGDGYTTVSCPQLIPSAPQCGLTVDPAAMTITVTNIYRDSDWGRMLTVDYTMATPPATAGTSTFNATEQDSSTPTPVMLPALPVAVNCPDGTGSIAVSPQQVTASQMRTLMFSYTAGGCGTQAGGLVELQVPDGWPSGGNVAWTGGGAASISGSTITAPAGNLAPGQTVTLSYGPVQAPAILQPYTFTAEEQSSQGGTLQPLSGPLTVTVTQAFVSPPGGAGMIAVSPRRAVAGRARTLTFTYTAPDGGLAASGEVTVQVPGEWTAPSRTRGQAGYVSSSEGAISASGRLITVTGVALAAGQQLTITYAAGIAPRLPGTSTFVTSERPDGTVRLAALARPASVTVIPAGIVTPSGPSSSADLLYLLIGLAAVVAVAAGVLAAHLLRRGGQVTAGASVRAVPHAGPPPTLAVRDTGRRPTLTVRLEPQASTAITTIKEGRS